MATAAMVQPPPPRGPPPPTSRPPPPPPPPRGPPPPSGPPPPPRGPPPPRARVTKRPHDTNTYAQKKQPRVSIIRPKTLRDVTVFQKKNQVGQGTYGSVFMGIDKDNSDVVALKRINTEQEENGFPITAIREVKILKALNNPNVVTLREIVTSKEKDQMPKSVYMVFEYLEYDLTGLLETSEIRLTQDHVKSWSQQLLSGVHYMHTNKIIHRDLKASNLLVNRKGELKIADFGLARSWNVEMKRLTNRVITLWYRPPELLLGCESYSPKIDMWSVGCIIAEMFRRSGFLKGSDEATQLDLIFKVAGHPTREEWPDLPQTCRLWKKFDPNMNGGVTHTRRISEALRSNAPNPHWITKHAEEIVDKLLILNPKDRWSASDALDAEYFFETPIWKKAEDLNMNFSVDSVHEW
eukprot:CAMPEP_0195517878 /NCGR_PEP_ID=MMETSP0794_2-20130614/11800_1 /TAXON_ID=515487 /ORGANISM="Stephanopyxis turris, Strain CCMP 815" /LENGTH=408 /DNA_ID=CAMNT_0040646755 /DNA_START=619 /DNA_END=1842 /DNA_ORIENTATION=-